MAGHDGRQFSRQATCRAHICRLAVDMDIHGYIHVWILDFDPAVDISMDMTMFRLANFLAVNLSVVVFKV